MRKIKYLMPILGITTLVGSSINLACCGGNGGGGGDTPSSETKLAAINVSNSCAIYIGSKNTNESKSLYKISNDGISSKLNGLDSEGKEVELNVDWLKKIDDDWIVLHANYKTYLLNVKNNKTYLVSEGIFHGSQRASNLIYQKDSSGNLYFVCNSDGKIKKLDVTDPDDLKLENYSAITDNVYDSDYFAINSTGELLYKINNTTLRYKSPTKGFDTIEVGENSPAVGIWTGFDDKLYFIDNFSDIYYLNENNEKIKYGNVYYQAHSFWFSQDGIIPLKKSNLILGMRNESNAAIGRIYNEQTFVPYFKDLGHSYNKWIGTDDTVYLARSKAIDIYKPNIDPTKDIFETIDMPQYDVLNLSALNNGTIIFHALRLKDNAYVMGTYINGVISELSETFDDKIEYIECITN